MTGQTQMLLRGTLAIGAAAIVVALLVSRFGAQPESEDAEREDREHAEQIEQRGGMPDEAPIQITAAALARHPGRIVEAEPAGRGGYEVEVAGGDGVTWKMRFDAAGALVREERED